MYKLYLKKGEYNQATQYYTNIIVAAVKRQFGTVEIADDVTYINKEDIVIIISIYSLIAVIRHRFNQKFIYWFQGIQPEEITFGLSKVSLRTRLRRHFMAFCEWVCLHKSKFNIFVSDAMLNHYRNKYHYKGNNYYIMPCYNQQLESSSFHILEKYSKPSIVYAGAMLPWQCVDELFQLYAKLKEHIPEASLTILTKDKEIVQVLIRKYNVPDVILDFVQLEDLNAYMSKFKYGFLLRSDDIVNNVATPTKFNSYLAVGVIPIVSKSIHAYRPIIDKMRFCISAEDEKDLDAVVNQIVKMELSAIDGKDVYAEYRQIFDTYYNTENHIANIAKHLSLIQ